tara:strand:+ start:2715 stop:3266 length:552 start_codon:yes stop_codon:yes gene_type:complete
LKVLFNGDSWCWGYSLENREDRYASLLAKMWEADFTDLSDHGCSNRRIFRTTISHDVSQYDLGIICMTFKNRTEFFLDGEWEHVNPGRGRGKKFLDYYMNYYEEEYGESDEFMFRQGIIDHFKANNTELLLLTVSKDTKYGYDLRLNTPDIPLGATKHPTKEGHRIIAQWIYETFNKMDTNPL